MPIYEYQSDGKGCEHCRNRFEVLQRMDEPPLAQCPECQEPCHRVLSAFAVTQGTRGMLSPKNLEQHGFTQYRKAGGGYYEKTCGKGPRTIKR